MGSSIDTKYKVYRYSFCWCPKKKVKKTTDTDQKKICKGILNLGEVNMAVFISMGERMFKNSIFKALPARNWSDNMHKSTICTKKPTNGVCPCLLVNGRI